MNLEILGQIIAGLGIFFFGIKLLSTSMQQMAGPKLRRMITRAMSRPLISCLAGLAGGMLMQKPSGVIAVLASMQSGGLITLRQAMPIVAWCNMGLSLLAFFVVIPIYAFICYIIGICGLMMMFSTRKKTVLALTAVFGAALLFFGLEQMKEGTNLLRQFDWFKHCLQYSNSSTIVALAVGIVLAAVTQTFVGIAVMAVSLVGAGALGEPQAMMVIYGANIGVGFFRRLITASLTGEAKQLFLYQNFFRYAGTGASILLFYAARIDGVPLMLYLAKLVTGDTGTQMAVVFLLCNLPAVIVAGIFQERFARLIERLSPPAPEDDLNKLRHLAAADRTDHRDMLDKLGAELSERARKLADYCEAARDGGRPKVSPEQLHASMETAMNELSAFETELAGKELSPEDSQRLSALMNIQTLLRMLDDTMFQMTCLARDRINRGGGPFKEPAGSLVEASEVLVMSLAEAMASGDPMDIEMLDKISADKRSVMKEFKRKYLDLPEGAAAAEKSVILDLSNHYEHSVWIINRLTSLIEKRR